MEIQLVEMASCEGEGGDTFIKLRESEMTLTADSHGQPFYCDESICCMHMSTAYLYVLTK
jgi:hypothetical protein